jgi:hypothetical protein
MSDLKKAHPDFHSPPRDDEEPLAREVDWSVEEEAKAKRK